METLKTLTVCQDWLDTAKDFMEEPFPRLDSALTLLRYDDHEHKIGVRFGDGNGGAFVIDVEASKAQNRLVVTPL